MKKNYLIKTIKQIFNWEKGLLKTFKQLLIEPRPVFKDFLKKRDNYVRPLTYFLFLFAILSLLASYVYVPEQPFVQLLPDKVKEVYDTNLVVSGNDFRVIFFLLIFSVPFLGMYGLLLFGFKRIKLGRYINLTLYFYAQFSFLFFLWVLAASNIDRFNNQLSSHQTLQLLLFVLAILVLFGLIVYSVKLLVKLNKTVFKKKRLTLIFRSSVQFGLYILINVFFLNNFLYVIFLLLHVSTFNSSILFTTIGTNVELKNQKLTSSRIDVHNLKKVKNDFYFQDKKSTIGRIDSIGNIIWDLRLPGKVSDYIYLTKGEINLMVALGNYSDENPENNFSWLTLVKDSISRASIIQTEIFKNSIFNSLSQVNFGATDTINKILVTGATNLNGDYLASVQILTITDSIHKTYISKIFEDLSSYRLDKIIPISSQNDTISHNHYLLSAYSMNEHGALSDLSIIKLRIVHANQAHFEVADAILGEKKSLYISRQGISPNHILSKHPINNIVYILYKENNDTTTEGVLTSLEATSLEQVWQRRIALRSHISDFHDLKVLRNDIYVTGTGTNLWTSNPIHPNNTFGFVSKLDINGQLRTNNYISNPSSDLLLNSIGIWDDGLICYGRKYEQSFLKNIMLGEWQDQNRLNNARLWVFKLDL